MVWAFLVHDAIIKSLQVCFMNFYSRFRCLSLRSEADVEQKCVTFTRGTNIVDKGAKQLL